MMLPWGITLLGVKPVAVSTPICTKHSLSDRYFLNHCIEVSETPCAARIRRMESYEAVSMALEQFSANFAANLPEPLPNHLTASSTVCTLRDRCLFSKISAKSFYNFFWSLLAASIFPFAKSQHLLLSFLQNSYLIRLCSACTGHSGKNGTPFGESIFASDQRD